MGSTVGGLCEAADPGFEEAGRRRTGLTEPGYKNGSAIFRRSWNSLSRSA